MAFSHVRGTPVQGVGRAVAVLLLVALEDELRVLVSHNVLITDFEKSTPPQNRQLIVYYYLLKPEVGGFVEQLNFNKYARALGRAVAVLLLVVLEDQLRVLISQNVSITDFEKSTSPQNRQLSVHYFLLKP